MESSMESRFQNIVNVIYVLVILYVFVVSCRTAPRNVIDDVK